MLEERIDWETPEDSAIEVDPEDAKLAAGVSVTRGWFFGSQEFGEGIQKRYRDLLGLKSQRREDG